MKALILDSSPQGYHLAEILFRAKGWSVQQAPGWREALSLLRQQPGAFDLVLAEVRGPDFAGLELWNGLRKPPLDKLPVILCHAAGDAEVERRIQDSGCGHSLAKPLQAKAVRQALNQLIPGRAVYFKPLDLVREEVGLDEETALELVADFARQIAELAGRLSGDLAASVGVRDIQALKDGALLLGTDQLVDFVHVRDNPPPDRSTWSRILGDIDEQVHALLPKPKKAAGKEPAKDPKPAAGAEESERPEDRIHHLLENVQATALVETETLREQLLGAARSGDHDKQFVVGMAYLRGDGFDEDRKEAMRWLQSAASHRHPQALCQLGLLQLESCKDNLGPEWMAAYQLLGAAAKLGCQDALFWSNLMRRGWHPEEPLNASVFHKAIGGDREAEYLLGLLYDRGGEVAPNTTEAVFWLRRAAEQGLAAAQHRLGLVFESGRGGEENREYALAWYEQAANQGCVEAMVSVGHVYETGSLAAPDPKLALRFYKRAAEAGDAAGRFHAARMLLEQSQDDQTRVAAGSWFAAAAAAGHGQARHAWDLLKATLPEPLVERIQSRVEEMRKAAEAARQRAATQAAASQSAQPAKAPVVGAA